MLLTRGCRLIVPSRGVAVGALVPVLEAARDVVLLAVAVPATVPVVAAAAPTPEDRAEEAEEQEQAEQREEEPEREEPEAPAVSVGMAVVHRRGAGGRCGLDDGLVQARVVRADGDEAADDEDRDEGEERTHG